MLRRRRTVVQRIVLTLIFTAVIISLAAVAANHIRRSPPLANLADVKIRAEYPAAKTVQKFDGVHTDETIYALCEDKKVVLVTVSVGLGFGDAYIKTITPLNAHITCHVSEK